MSADRNPPGRRREDTSPASTPSAFARRLGDLDALASTYRDACDEWPSYVGLLAVLDTLQPGEGSTNG